MTKNQLTFGLIAFWVGVICLGFVQIYDYTNQPGEQGQPPLVLPQISNFEKSNLPKLIFFAHPQCPCSHAGLQELSKILSKLEGRIDTHIVFHHPKEMSLEWVKSSLWKKAKQLKGAAVTIDTDGKMVELFRPKTSGQVYLYSNGEQRPLIYSGGVTSTRGHEGDNTGSDAIVNWVLHKKVVPSKFAVFGCSLFHNGFSHEQREKS